MTNLTLRGGSFIGPNDAETLLKNKGLAYIVDTGASLRVALGGEVESSPSKEGLSIKYTLPVASAETLGDNGFKSDYNTKYAYMGGSMAHAISSVEMVIAMRKAGFLCSYGTGGLRTDEIEAGVTRLKEALGNDIFCVNMLNNANTSVPDMSLAKILVDHDVPVIEASAYINATKGLIYYRLSGLSVDEDGEIIRGHKIIAKVSREEIAMNFMMPPDEKFAEMLVKEGMITQEQADLAQFVPIADDIIVEGDSGGHTDNRPLITLLPTFLAIRDSMMESKRYATRIRIGAAGGIATPEAAFGAFEMGAGFVVVGSINQSCIEAGTSSYVKDLLSQLNSSDVQMTPGADAFEFGSRVQAVKKNTMEPMIGQKLYETYIGYKSYEDVPEKTRNRIETIYFKKPIDEVWDECVVYFSKNNTMNMNAASLNGKLKMALLFRWYIGQSVSWAIAGNMDRAMDMMIMCGPSMGVFNEWAKGTYLEKPENRKVAVLAMTILEGAAVLKFSRMAEFCGVDQNSLPRFKIHERA